MHQHHLLSDLLTNYNNIMKLEIQSPLVTVYLLKKRESFEVVVQPIRACVHYILKIRLPDFHAGLQFSRAHGTVLQKTKEKMYYMVYPRTHTSYKQKRSNRTEPCMNGLPIKQRDLKGRGGDEVMK